MSNSGKHPGKTEFSGRRRSVTRKSGHKSHPDVTGGELKILQIPTIKIDAGEVIEVLFELPSFNPNEMVGYGGWYSADDSIVPSIKCVSFNKSTLTGPDNNNWSKFGAMWMADTSTRKEIKVTFKAKKSGYIAFYGLGCGVIENKHLEWAKKEKPVLLKNMYQFSPEANFYVKKGKSVISREKISGKHIALHLKSCNRCAQFLPINTNNERISLSFSNHCVAEHRRPCSHAGFGKLKNIDTGEVLRLEYGYQLECRFCKKFEVNAAHNPQRTAAQMKEDGARRRALELLLMELYGQSKQLRYRHAIDGKELTDDIWDKFSGKCFNCGIKIETKKKMHLDHTRPLALLWPLDATATCLCSSCNSQKRDRAPSEFYTDAKLHKLSAITGIPYHELVNPTPNTEVINFLRKRLDWFFTTFCNRAELKKVRDGKVASELLIKAIQKTLNKCADGAPFNIQALYKAHEKKRK